MSTIVGEFKKLSKIVQVLLLLIPGVNWITEIVVRVSAFMHGKSNEQLIVLIFAILPTGVLLGWIDLIWVIVYNRLILT